MKTETHPYPALARSTWKSLNGKWNFRFDDDDMGLADGWQNGFSAQYEIMVPFCYQSVKSGIGITKAHNILWYSRVLTVSAEMLSGSVLLHFGAVDYSCTVWVNGSYSGEHIGGSTHFSLNIKSFLHVGDNLVVLRATDSFSCEIPRGKQCWSEQLTRCWYTQTSGIWKNVWVETTGTMYIQKLRITPDVDHGCAEAELYLNTEATYDLELIISFHGHRCYWGTVHAEGSVARILIPIKNEDYIDDIHCWSPETPDLYDVRVRVMKEGSCSDEVQSYFGMRKIECRNGRIFLNNRELFQRLVLDQGYWPETLMTPPGEDALIQDIKITKQLGFNGARKHQKFEDSRYYYWANCMGLLVWGECPSAYEFTVRSTENLLREWLEFVDEHYNDPCIIVWVPFNESWGLRKILTDSRQQAQAAAFYYLTKALDPTRLVSTNDGWETIEQSDIIGIHDYEANVEELRTRYQDWGIFLEHGIGYKQPICHGHSYRGQPVLISEYGGIAFEDGSAENWGYHDKAVDEEDFLQRLDAITAEVQRIPYCCGFCYTQLTDVMQETNGLLTADRKTKINSDRLRNIFARRQDELKP